MATAVVVCNNIYDENGVKRVNGDQFEASKEFTDAVLKGDKAAGRKPRITVIGGKKAKADENG